MPQKSPQKYSAELCEHLYSAPKHVVSMIRWEPTAEGNRLFQATVLTDDELTLDLVGYWEPPNRFRKAAHWGFTLRYQGHVVRTYDMAKVHKNPGGGRIKGPHKHKFVSSKIDRYAYAPDPPISTSDPRDALADFLKECNIELNPMFYPDFKTPLS